MRNLLRITRCASVLGLLAAVEGCTCRAYVEVLPAAGGPWGGQITLMAGDTVTLVAQGQKYFGDGGCSDAGQLLGPGSAARPSDYQWSATPPDVVSVLPDGRVIAKSPGQGSVTVEMSRESAEAAFVPVLVIPRIDSVTIEPATATVFLGDTVSFRISEWVGASRLPVRFPGVIDPHLREVSSPARTVNMVRTDPARVLLRAELAGTARLYVWSSTYRYHLIPQDTATLEIQPP